MANTDKKVTLWLNLKDGISAGVKKMSDNTKKMVAKSNAALDKLKLKFKKLGDQVNEAKFVFAAVGVAVVAATAKALQAYGKQEAAIVGLNQALKNTGNYSEEASQDLQDYASSLQAITTYGDEAILESQALIASFGFEGQALKQLTKATADLATAKGMDLKNAADLVSKAVGSSTNALSRYGITIEGTAGSTDRAKSAVEAITALFGGQAEAQAKTFNGAIKQLNNSLGDIWELIGSVLAPTVQKFAVVLTGISEAIKKTDKAIIASIVGFVAITGAFAGFLAVAGAFTALAPMLGAAFTIAFGPIGITVVAIAALTAGITYLATSSSRAAQIVRAAWGTIGEVIKVRTEMVRGYLLALGKSILDVVKIFDNLRRFDFEGAKESFASLQNNIKSFGTVGAAGVEKIKTKFNELLKAQQANTKESEKLAGGFAAGGAPGGGAAPGGGGGAGAGGTGSLEAYLESKKELEIVAAEFTRELQEQERLFREMDAEQRLQLLTDTLGGEAILRAQAKAEQAAAEGDFKAAELINEELYQTAFVKLNQTRIDQVAKAEEKARKAREKEIAKHRKWEELSAEEKDKVVMASAHTASNFMGTLAAVAKAQGKEGFETYKKFAQAQALIATYESAVKAFNSLASIPVVGPALGAVAATGAVVAGLLRVRQIENTSVAAEHGGVYSGSAAGTQVTFAEKNKAEAFIPLEDERGKDAIKDAFGGQGDISVRVYIAGQEIRPAIVEIESEKETMRQEGIL